MNINPKKFIICSLILTLFVFPLYYTSSPISSYNSKQNSGENSLQISAYYNTPIMIDDLPGSLNNWTWAKDQGYCTGTGTNSDPYRIRNHIFNTSTTTPSPLWIQHSLKHFIIENCYFIADLNYGGIYLYNVSNGIITKNTMGANSGALVYMRNSSYNTISNNIASNGVYGLVIAGVLGPTRYNTISDNIISNNSILGIDIRDGCESNTISGNIINNNGLGIYVDGITTNNIIYLNCLNNTFNAEDDGTNNQWDYGNKGNYWADYAGVDANNNGIGDTPYGIGGTAGAQDHYPLMKCPGGSSGGGIPGYNIAVLLGSLMILIVGITYLTLKKVRNSF